MAENKLDGIVKILSSASIINNFLIKAGKQIMLIIVLKLEHRLKLEYSILCYLRCSFNMSNTKEKFLSELGIGCKIKLFRPI